MTTQNITDVEFDVSESSAEYIRIKLARATDLDEVNELREQLAVLEAKLLERHKRLVDEHNKKHGN